METKKRWWSTAQLRWRKGGGGGGGGGDGEKPRTDEVVHSTSARCRSVSRRRGLSTTYQLVYTRFVSCVIYAETLDARLCTPAFHPSIKSSLDPLHISHFPSVLFHTCTYTLPCFLTLFEQAHKILSLRRRESIRRYIVRYITPSTHHLCLPLSSTPAPWFSAANLKATSCQSNFWPHFRYKYIWDVPAHVDLYFILLKSKNFLWSMLCRASEKNTV